ncbi:hypothetical protein ACLN6N_12915 [Sphingomonas carotinifaciens]|uniref:High-potential iron-sulfur protein n=1 Tax=Sphingomonas carotinifaciens TaxID=1166323 RepID=A0A1G7G728_9SPHN|nr:MULTISPECIES: hypothetical protein [Sphingomonas]MBB4086416.1 hypothetical protein [Sphingomonas carotinifaciens]MWC42735.1 hypothetical protein [Sphingomonas carotinifaciens]SDE83938.1 hypothetical protein SAMN05216557_101738 [Sphingomonas carotinifaciens]
MPLTTAGAAACAKCKFFDTDSARSDASLGLCRYNPPISQPSGEAAGVWPKVEASDWCGHFEAVAA